MDEFWFDVVGVLLLAPGFVWLWARSSRRVIRREERKD